MNRCVLLDTGPLVALLNRRDKYHQWAKDQVASITPPLLTCESVLSQACFLLRTISPGSQQVISLVQRKLVTPQFQLSQESVRIAEMLKRYANIPMSLADACLVRMAEQHGQSEVMTLDSGFLIYRKNGRQVIPTIMPADVERVSG